MTDDLSRAIGHKGKPLYLRQADSEQDATLGEITSN